MMLLTFFLRDSNPKSRAGGILGYKKRVVRYKPVPPDPDMHNAMCSAKVINI